MEPTLAEVRLFAGNFAPRQWEFREGQLLPISQNQALFSLLGTTYGGDRKTTFALPDLRGIAPIGPGDGPGLPSYRDGQKGGATTTTLTVASLPSHNHMVNANNAATSRDLQSLPGNHFIAQNGDGSGNFATTADTTMNAQMIGNTGGSQLFNNMQPYLAIYYIIALMGIYPSRS